LEEDEKGSSSVEAMDILRYTNG